MGPFHGKGGDGRGARSRGAEPGRGRCPTEQDRGLVTQLPWPAIPVSFPLCAGVSVTVTTVCWVCEWQARDTGQTSLPFNPEVSRLKGSHTRRADLRDETRLQADAAAGDTGGLGRGGWQGGRVGVSERRGRAGVLPGGAWLSSEAGSREAPRGA